MTCGNAKRSPRLSHRVRVGWSIALLLVAGCSAAAPSAAPRTEGRSLPPSTSGRGGVTPSWSPAIATFTPTPSGPSRIIDHGDRAGDAVALTFTVGYRLEPAIEILELLRSRGVSATIFMSGIVFDQEATQADAERVLEIVAERPDLFQLGQHGYSASELADLPAEEVIAEVRGAERSMVRYGVAELRPYFSPPGGAWSPELLATLGALGYSTTVLWDVDPLDWKPPSDGGPSVEEVATRVLDRIQAGSIVLLHLGGWNTLPALPAIVDGLTGRGLRPVTVAELLDDV